jgi:hypothetical protein
MELPWTNKRHEPPVPGPYTTKLIPSLDLVSKPDSAPMPLFLLLLNLLPTLQMQSRNPPHLPHLLVLHNPILLLLHLHQNELRPIPEDPPSRQVVQSREDPQFVLVELGRKVTGLCE